MVLKQVDIKVVLHFLTVYDSIWAESSTHSGRASGRPGGVEDRAFLGWNGSSVAKADIHRVRAGRASERAGGCAWSAGRAIGTEAIAGAS